MVRWDYSVNLLNPIKNDSKKLQKLKQQQQKRSFTLCHLHIVGVQIPSVNHNFLLTIITQAINAKSITAIMIMIVRNSVKDAIGCEF
jgi:hypothetical protein